MWRTHWLSHKDSIDVGVKLGLGIIGFLGVLIAVHQYKLSHKAHELAKEEHRRQINADLAAREDAIARHITDLSAKASEQLGSEKAAVRIGGLTDLERLGQAYPNLRQTVVDRICSYLRAPFNPSLNLHSLAEREAIEHQLELDVRNTAQTILQRHLLWPGDDTPPDTFWEAVTLDLRGAQLLDFAVEECVLEVADFRNTTFHGNSYFTGSNITLTAHFKGAKFLGHALFRDAWLRATDFNEAIFFKATTFSGLVADSDIHFTDAKFKDDASFKGAHFLGYCRFDRATFEGDADFSGARFDSWAEFGNATFDTTPKADGALSKQEVQQRCVWPAGWQLATDPDGGEYLLIST